MDYFISETQEDGLSRTAGVKARDDLETLLLSQGYLKISIPVSAYDRKKAGSINKLRWHYNIYKIWKDKLSLLKKNDRVIVQFPIIEHSLLLPGLLKKLVRKGIDVNLVIHDLELLRAAKRDDVSFKNKLRLSIEEKNCLKNVSYIIVHNEHMKKFLMNEFQIHEDQLVSLEIFDYLIDDFDSNKMKVFDKSLPIIIAGNLRQHKAAYVYDLPDNVNFNLYGIDYTGKVNDKIQYHGSYPPDELPYALSGSFGLVWDGISSQTCTGVYGEYLKINNPHKTSLYLACGIPVVIWSQAALADFIIQNKCGITVENIKDIENKLSSLSGDEYNTIKKNAEKIGRLLREGYYTKQAVKNCVS